MAKLAYTKPIVGKRATELKQFVCKLVEGKCTYQSDNWTYAINVHLPKTTIIGKLSEVFGAGETDMNGKTAAFWWEVGKADIADYPLARWQVSFYKSISRWNKLQEYNCILP